MVRRVAAVEGDELITDDPADASYTVPDGAHPANSDLHVFLRPITIESYYYWHFCSSYIMGMQFL